MCLSLGNRPLCTIDMNMVWPKSHAGQVKGYLHSPNIHISTWERDTELKCSTNSQLIAYNKLSQRNETLVLLHKRMVGI